MHEWLEYPRVALATRFLWELGGAGDFVDSSECF